MGYTRMRDVQLLLWAVGEARDRDRRGAGDRTNGLDDHGADEGAEFFTEWQPATR
jgi:hypothetical protein